MIELSVQHLKKSFEVGEILLDDLSFEIRTGECVGIMGRNGCGKTTLFRIITGEIPSDGGEVIIAPGRRIGLISQIPVYPAGYTVENVLRSAYRDLYSLKQKMERMEYEMTSSSDGYLLAEYDRLSTAYEVGGGYEMDINVDKICNGLGIPVDMRIQLFSELSGGEKTRVNLARLLLEETDILLLDEPTNHLDIRSVEWLEAYIKQFKGTTLTISHDRYFLDRVVDRIIEISDGKADHYNGNYSFYLEEKQARFNLQLKQYEQEQAKIKQLSFTVERMKGWGINNRVLYRRAMSIQHRIDRMQKTERPKTEKSLKARFGEKEFFGDMVFSVKDLAKRYGNKQLFSDVELQVEGGERIAIIGDNGTGKTTFLRCLLGEEPVDAGRIRFGPTVRFGYLPQVMHFEHPERTLYDTMLYEKNCTPQAARDRLGAFLFSGEDVFKTVGTLSGGEQSRLRLCMLMDDKINLLILDEPTNHLDIASREWIECALDEYEGTLLFISHDRYFVDKFATRIWELEDGAIHDYPCGYAKYRALKDNASIRPIPQTVKQEKKIKAPEKTDKKALEKEVRRLEREIEKQEQVIADLDRQIEMAASNYQELARLSAEREDADEKLTDLMEQWEKTDSQIESNVP
ncbi:MAG: ABC-F family ATP-binding cassette domain-containing protein [Lachnospiraceae bacterium]|nr:ABC-F family ATP-binding cassette domain-containing protein [Lachnospiraceae bacterium]